MTIKPICADIYREKYKQQELQLHLRMQATVSKIRLWCINWFHPILSRWLIKQNRSFHLCWWRGWETSTHRSTQWEGNLHKSCLLSTSQCDTLNPFPSFSHKQQDNSETCQWTRVLLKIYIWIKGLSFCWAVDKSANCLPQWDVRLFNERCPCMTLINSSV